LSDSHLVLAAVSGQGWRQIGELGLAFVLSSLIGLEREWRQKSAGLRTHTLVGMGAALFIIIGKYGFNDVLSDGRVILDPSRIAAGVVSGIGFIGGGLLFVRGDIVRGLTTAAIVWMTAAIGMACGAALVLLALAVTAASLRRRLQQIEGGRIAGVPAVAVTFEVRGKPTIEELTVALDKLDGVLGVETTDFMDDGG
jgi:hypothetical protein